MANELRGFEPKIKVNGTLWDVKEGEVNETVETARGDTTGQGMYKQNVINKCELEITVKALRYVNLNPHITPLYIAPTQNTPSSVFVPLPAAIIYYPNGYTVGDDTTAWRSPNFVWTSYSESFNADSGLLTLSAKGVSTGVYKRPGDA